MTAINLALYELALVRNLIPGGEYAVATEDGDGIDTTGYDAILIIQSCLGDASGTVDTVIEESSDDGDVDAYAPISDAVFVQVTTAVSIKVMHLLTQYYEPWLRASTTVAAAASGACVVALLYRKRGTMPVTQSETVVSLVP